MRNEKGKSENLYSAISNNIYILSIAAKLCPSRVIMGILTNLMTTLIGFCFLLFIEMLVNGLQNNVGFNKLVIITIVYSVVLLLVRAFQNIYDEKIKLIKDQILLEKMNILIFNKAVEADINCYEDSEFYDNYTRAAAEANVRMTKVIDTIANIISGVIVAVCYLVKLASIDLFSVVIVLMPVISTWVMGKRLNQLSYQLNMSNVLHNRKKEYIKRTFYLQKYAKELRLFRISDVLTDIFNDSVKHIYINIKAYCYKMMWFRLFQRLLAGSLPTIGFMIYKMHECIKKPVGISDFIVLFYGILSLSSAMEDLLKNLLMLQENSLYISNLKKFMNHVPSIKNEPDAMQIPTSQIESIQFVNVSFSYPNAVKPVLQNINLIININKQEKIAIVGHNGAGKSTFIKLILRLYDPTDGEILLNGQNIKKYRLMEYRKLFGTVFQDFNMFSMTVAENVLMRKIEPRDQKLVEHALKKSGMEEKVVSFKNGINTMLTREFDNEGEVLSGGQNQKIAIARAFATNCQLLILDEPSSALDPIAENLVWKSMLEVCKQKGAIFISHRLSASKLADIIYMIENGNIIEEGSHEYLMKLNGKYADMFSKQAADYQLEQ